MFENLKLYNYKGLKECELTNLGQINVICGKNNTGKSTVLEAINSITNRYHGKLITPEFIDQIKMETIKSVDFINLPERKTTYDKILKKVFPLGLICYEHQLEEVMQNIVKAIKTEGLPPHMQFDIFSRGLSRILSKSLNTLLIPPKRQLELSKNIQASDTVYPAGVGILNQLFFYRNLPEGTAEKEIYNNIRTHFTEISNGYVFDIYMNSSNVANLNFSRGGNEWITAGDCGLGLQDLLVILWFAADPNLSVLLVEEPESHIHPEMQRKLLDFLRSQANKQFFLSSHSNVFVNSAYADKIFFTQYTNNVKVADATNRAAVLNDLGYSVADNLVSDLVIFVEGPKDVPVIEEFLIKMGAYSKYTIKIWPLGGDIMDQLDMSVFSENYKLIALVDNDPFSNSIREKFVKKCKEYNIPIHKTKRYSIENYFSLRAIRSVFENQINPNISEIKHDEKLENQIGINVKKNNRKIAQAMSLDEITGTDLEEFLHEVIDICKS